MYIDNENEQLSIIDEIAAAFRQREKPSILVNSSSLTDFEEEDVNWIKNKFWHHIDGDELEEHCDIVAWLTPEAFCYYLPGFMTVALLENSPALLVNETILMLLDHASPPNQWDDFSLQRWGLLNKQECEAVETWIWWLAKTEEYKGESDRLERALFSIAAIKHLISWQAHAQKT